MQKQMKIELQVESLYWLEKYRKTLRFMTLQQSKGAQTLDEGSKIFLRNSDGVRFTNRSSHYFCLSTFLTWITWLLNSFNNGVFIDIKFMTPELKRVGVVREFQDGNFDDSKLFFEIWRCQLYSIFTCLRCLFYDTFDGILFFLN